MAKSRLGIRRLIGDVVIGDVAVRVRAQCFSVAVSHADEVPKVWLLKAVWA
jgi:hypothetical protein